MKKAIKPILLLLAISSLTLHSCKKEEEQEEETQEITEEEAVEVMEASLKSNNAGINESVEKSSEELINTYLPMSTICDSVFENSYTKSYNGTLLTANYTLSTQFSFDCPTNFPEIANVSASINGQYSGRRVNSNDNSTLSLTFDSILPSCDYFLVHGSLTRNGTESLSTSTQNFDFSSTTVVTASNVKVNKATNLIQSGTANLTLNIVTSNGTNQSFSALVTFNGQGSATITINGNSYTISI